jgi:hypothetical protein
VAQALRATIRSCQLQTTQPAGAGFLSFNRCVSIPVRQNIERAHVEPLMLLSALRNMRAGPCSAMTNGLGGELAALGQASNDWMATIQADRPDPVQAGQVINDLLGISTAIIRNSRSPGWRTSCHPRPYDPAEHQ